MTWANHYFIHAVEKVQPSWGLNAARVLDTAGTGAGHLEHMPSHIYFRVGRYWDTARVNRRAIDVDEQYRQACDPTDIYGHMYIPHNMDFYVAAASMLGRKADALREAERLANYARPLAALHPEMAELQQFLATPQLVRVQFGMWGEILTQPLPETNLPYARALHHYARAVAFINQRQMDQAAHAITELAAAIDTPQIQQARVMYVNSAADILSIARDESRGLFLEATSQDAAAVALLAAAAHKQESLNYMEPPPWFRSVRRILGSHYLQRGNFKEAELQFRADLRQLPENGWGLLGLKMTLDGQGHADDSNAIRERFDKAWEHADIELALPVIH